ncbi:MAG: UPF0149 family protein [bacterium]|nr:UPF0149 family protein [bacterium]
MAAKEKLGKHVFDLRVSLRDISPEIWRLISVSADVTLEDLHRTIQGAFKWQNYHLHEFVIGGKLYDGGKGSRTALRKLLHVGDRVLYRYDMGDYWQHDIEVVRMYEVPNRRHHPKVLDGARNGPPEDIGGPPGYEEYARTADARALESFDPQLATWRAQALSYREKPAKPAPRRKPAAPSKPTHASALDALVAMMDAELSTVQPNVQAVLGFFTCLFAGPLLMPSLWMPFLLGDFDLRGWSDMSEVQAVIGTTMEAYNQVGSRVYDGDFTGMQFDRAWTQGFMAGVAAGGEHWKQALRDEDLKIVAAPILLSSLPNAKMEPNPELIRASVRGLVAWWSTHQRERLGTSEPVRRSAPKISPNDLCPCGSGKKYKRCCSPLRAV